MTSKLSLYEAYRHALAACDGKFVGHSLTLHGYRILSVVGEIPVIGQGRTYEEALVASICQLDRFASLWDMETTALELAS